MNQLFLCYGGIALVVCVFLLWLYRLPPSEPPREINLDLKPNLVKRLMEMPPEAIERYKERLTEDLKAQIKAGYKQANGRGRYVDTGRFRGSWSAPRMLYDPNDHRQASRYLFEMATKMLAEHQRRHRVKVYRFIRARRYLQIGLRGRQN